MNGRTSKALSLPREQRSKKKVGRMAGPKRGRRSKKGQWDPLRLPQKKTRESIVQRGKRIRHELFSAPISREREECSHRGGRTAVVVGKKVKCIPEQPCSKPPISAGNETF